MNRYRTLRSPINIQIEITQACNFKCKHCYNYFRHDAQMHNSLDIEHIDYIVNELKKNRVFRGVITGGEPLIYPDRALYLARHMNDIGMRVTLNSNMSLFNAEIGRELKKVGTNTILASLVADNHEIHDDVTQGVGNWNESTAGIKLAVSMGFRVLVNMVLTKWNIDRVEQTGDLVGSWGVNKFGATRACAPGPIAKDFAQKLISLEELRHSLNILEKLKWKWGYEIDVFEHYPWCAISDVERYSYLSRRKCTAGITSASIGADGQLRPCGHSPKTYGSVLERGLTGPWLNMDDWRKGVYSKSCFNCKFLQVCTGGCPVEAENSENGKDHHCTDENDVISLPRPPEYKQISPDDEFVVSKGVLCISSLQHGNP